MVITAADLTEHSAILRCKRLFPESFQKGVSPSLLDPRIVRPRICSPQFHIAQDFFGPHLEVMLNFLTVIARSESILKTLPGIPRHLRRVKMEREPLSPPCR